VELQACQRYCFASTGVIHGAGHLRLTNIADWAFYLPAIPRRAGTTTDLRYTKAEAALGIYDVNIANNTITSLSIVTTGHCVFVRYNLSSNFTAGYGAFGNFENLIINFEI
jgi:hypothetical protein